MQVIQQSGCKCSGSLLQRSTGWSGQYFKKGISMIYTLYQIDSFTKKRFTGNPAGVVTNADDLDEATMQKIAREMNNSETAFVFDGKPGKYDVQVRFFTPLMEVPMCGHATIAAHYALAVERSVSSGRLIQKVGVGCLPVDIIQQGQDYKIVMTQGDIQFEEPLSQSLSDEIKLALGLQENDMIKNAPIQVVSTGHSKVFVGINSFEQLKQLTPDYSRLIQISQQIKCNGYLVFTPESPKSDCLISARMFGPSIGINEDPVNGSSGGALGAYLIHHNVVSTDGQRKFNFKVYQGFAVGRKGKVEVEIELNEQGQPEIGRIIGDAVIVFKTTIDV